MGEPSERNGIWCLSSSKLFSIWKLIHLLDKGETSLFAKTVAGSVGPTLYEVYEYISLSQISQKATRNTKNNTKKFKKGVWEWGRDSTGSRHREVTGSYENGTETSDVIKAAGFLDYLKDYQPLRKKSYDKLVMLYNTHFGEISDFYLHHFIVW
jgi:hypothetical protein